MHTIIMFLEIVGTIAFAISGAVSGIKKQADIFGVLFLGVTTAVGGGIIRDVSIGNVPPMIFTNYIYVILALATSLIIFIIIYIEKDLLGNMSKKVDGIINMFDALGLGIFTINGMNVVLFQHSENNPFLVIFVGLATGIGGGIVRDTLTNTMPFVLYKHVYAVAALLGAIVYFLLYSFTNINYTISMAIGVVIIFSIRILSGKYNWNLPKIELN